MAVSLTFDANSSLSIADLPDLVDLVAFETPLDNMTSTSFSGVGVIYTGPGQSFGMDATFLATGSGFAYVTLGDTFVYEGILDTVTVTHQGADVTMSNMSFDIETLVPILTAESDGTNILGLETFLLQQEWNATLSNNADIAPRGAVFGDGGVFNMVGNDVVRGMGGDDNLYTGDGNDRLFGGTGADRLDGGDGNDRVLGGVGNDVVIGGNGNDRLYGNDGDDRVIGGRGQDRIYGSDGLDRLYGGSSADVIVGGNDRDYINGGIGNDRLYGGNGWDQLYGNAGNDLLVGGTGADDFIFRDGQGDNTIRDFDALNNAEDIILRGVTAITSYADLAANHMVQSGADVVIDDGAGLTITLQNVDLDDLGARDFIF